MDESGIPDLEWLPLTVTSPRRQSRLIHVRNGTNDAATVHSTMWAPGDILHDEYGLTDVHLGPGDWALDIGAHIGSVALALAIDNPECRVIAVEAVPDNVTLLTANATSAEVADRVHVVGEAAAGEGVTEVTLHCGHYDVPGIPPDHAAQARFIGNLFREHGPRGSDIKVPAVSLSALLDRFGVDEVAFTKIDCEGGEWAFLASPAVARLRVIVGEWHDGTAADLTALLDATHDVDILEDGGGIGLFRATRRAG